LRRGGVIKNEALPFDLQVLDYAKNSNLVDAGPDAPEGETFTSRVGQRFRLVKESETAGADPDQHVDAPMARVAFRAKDKDDVLATHTLSLWFYPNVTKRLPLYRFPPTQVKAGGKEYTVELRYRRAYKPYAVHLLEFRHDLYIGTETPKNFSSRVRLTDPERGEDRELVIRMNDPLRYRGETFYQSSYLPGDKGTILQVVRNPGWLMPYISCFMVTVGMIAHFGTNLLAFLRKGVAL
jgi:hypothetical protein